MKKIFFTILIGILSVGFIYANNCYKNSRCFHFAKNRNVYCENSKINNRGQERPRDGRQYPENGRRQGRHQGECQNPDKGPGYGRGEGRGQGRYRND
ncbi:MAG: hypothetical protein AMS24_02630 [Chlamydiae bacterium SM23_39]|nr:MAG: hypothetical protein AMS24_02630 [Chlamydiae bacterium SM23_39]